MTTEDRVAALTAYLSRLTGTEVSADSPLRIRSVQRAALVSWARKQALPVRFELLAGSAATSARELLGDGGAVVAQATPLPALAPGLPSGLAIGIDIEEVAALPEAGDYRAHPFFADNFTPAELGYCIRQADVRASLCGMWAAKEAIVKAGVADAPFGQLRRIEIGHDARGRPVFAGCEISISHTARTAVAVCVAGGGMTAAAAPAPVRARAEAIVTLPPARRKFGWGKRALAAAACVIVIIAGGVLSLALRAAG